MITYNDKAMTAGAKVLDVRRPLLAPQSLNMLSMEMKHGSFFYSKTSGNLPIELDVMILGKDRSEVRDNIRDFAEFINADEPKRLIVHDEPDKYVLAIVSGDTALENFYRLGKGTITMIAPDPFYYAVNDDVVTFSDTNTHTFTRKGNTDSYPIIEIKGTSTSGGFTVSHGNTSMTYTGKLSAGESLFIDSNLMTAYVLEVGGTKRSAVPFLNNLDFPVLNKGSNSIKVSAKDGAVLEKYTVSCNSRWM